MHLNGASISFFRKNPMFKPFFIGTLLAFKIGVRFRAKIFDARRMRYMFDMENAMTIRLDDELPTMPVFDPKYRRAPDRGFTLNQHQTELAQIGRAHV